MRRVVQALLLLAMLGMASGATWTDQSFVVIGEAAIEDTLAANPDMEMPTILMEVSASSQASAQAGAQAGGIVEQLLNPRIARQNELIAQNHELLASMELISQQLGAPVLSQLEAEKSSGLVAQLQAALSPKPRRSNVQYLTDADHQLPTALLESAPIKINQKISPMLAGEDELRMLEVGVDMELEAEPAAAAPAKKGPKHDYAFLDDPKSGGEPTSLQNLQGLDIYVVNTPLEAADHEIRPVAPPRPLSAGARQKARMGERMRAQLVRDVPQPKPRVAPKTRINTLSAYESSLQPSAPLAKLSRLAERPLEQPMVGGHGALPMRGATAADAEAVLGAVPTPPAAAQARFAQQGMDDDFYGEPRSFVQRDAAAQKQQLPGTSNTPDLPHFPKDPNAAPLVARVYDTGSSFDNRDGPPVLLDDLLPLKAHLVEDLNPYIEPPGKPTGW